MNRRTTGQHTYHNRAHALILLLGMIILLVLIGWLIAGPDGIAWSFIIGTFIIISTPRLSPHLILHRYNAQIISPKQATELYTILYQLSRKTSLDFIPRLYYIPTRLISAFTIGYKENTSIAISDGMLRKLNLREINTVLAHEISHIHNRDLLVMSIADSISRLTSLMATMGYLLIMIYIPLYLISQQSIPWALLILLVIAPNISALLQLGLSRNREYTADMDAAYITGDPAGLASTLSKIEYYQGKWIERAIFPYRNIPDPSLLRTHPSTTERIRRLKLIEEEMKQGQIQINNN
ncbi:MAG: zinc metalloprotease HtpX [Gammaproteobacteria bacterium]|nr:zinc metalloprotease HtpX [Gammaproteobacteria bacterium]